MKSRPSRWEFTLFGIICVQMNDLKMNELHLKSTNILKVHSEEEEDCSSASDGSK